MRTAFPLAFGPGSGRRLARLAALLLAAVPSASGCTQPTGLLTRCGADADCPPGFACDLETGACRCRSDASCAADEFCNGRTCQKRVGCDTSLDCPAGTFCDRRSGNCVDSERCSEDVQCAIGEVCDAARLRCMPGCRDAGDCRLGEVCRCPGGTSCALMQCEAGSCDDNSWCRYGERCTDTPDGRRCVRDERGPYCEACQYTPGSSTHCPGDDAANFCLLDRKVTWRRTYCGVDCSDGQECPWGYECRNILVLTRSLCEKDGDCPAGGQACTTDADCPGARCDAAAGRCAGRCSYNEDSKSGYCTCTADNECPRESCDPVSWRCSITRRPCTPDGGECDRAIHCVNLGDRAACLIGRNCTPSDGLRCEDVLPPSAP